ncbi:MAG: ABC transporter ATP-binding protein [Rhodobacteraceae bacterium]|nr:ABC transporter ATP-binding protein [Paracoccaceae bacterium]
MLVTPPQQIVQAAADAGDWLVLRGLGQRFGGRTVLRDIDLGLRQGEVVCLVGPSGCGKSTLLRLIAGVDRPQTGSITLNGATLCGEGVFVEPEDRAIGLMFQDYALFPHLSVAQNIMFGLRGLPKAQAQALCNEVIARLGIGSLAERHPHMLSGGEQQRVALARALAPRPRVMLMDEPFSNLDKTLRDGIRDETLALLRDLGTTTLIVTHDPEEALSAGNRVALMRAGTIVQCGDAAEIYDRPTSAYAAEFFGECNRFDAVCRGGRAETALGSFAAPGQAEGAPLRVLVRPHAIALHNSTTTTTTETGGATTRIGDAGADAVVIAVSLMGEIEQITLRLAGSPVPLRVRSTERRAARAGIRVNLSVNPAGIFVFPAVE